MTGAMEYLKDPAAIYELSFATIRAETDLARLPESVRPLAVRLIHACGMVDLADDLRFSDDVVLQAREALIAGCKVITDCEMAAAGIIRRLLPASNQIVCTLNDPQTSLLAAKHETTRSAAAVSLWPEHLDGAVVVIGNAPTALFALLELLDETAVRPAAILGFPVGFVGAAESKDALAADPRGVPFATVLGRRGGSAMASAALNAISAGSAR
ncbi:MAG: precorrin-8X methylmutase [Pseudomonadota bacterium]